ncbi:hypothetical protein [Kitasatospora sp. NPDC092286]|uniref:hypothetical protein n=1 Tax=Kitasatospora sp. NPDC092286 TaxID=3364087 RepID=UPI00380AD27A
MGALWILLLVGLLTSLPCAGQAQAVTGHRHASSQVAAAATTALTTTLAGPAAGAAGAPGVRQARAGGPDRQSAAPHTGPAHRTADRPDAGGHRHWTWCSADGELPQRNNGCSSHPYCAQEAQLPNPPPQPQPAVAPRTEAAETLPRLPRAGLLVGPHPAPDLHELQVHRS